MNPSSVWLRPAARKLRYRLYQEVNNQVVTDAILR